MYDIFLGGPWEKYTSQPYKSLIKSAFPELSIYDPENMQHTDWFNSNLDALRHVKILIVFAPAFPMPGVAVEAGIYYEHRLLMGRKPQLITIWPDAVQPEWGREVIEKMGAVVKTTEEAIELIRRFTESENEIARSTYRNGL